MVAMGMEAPSIPRETLRYDPFSILRGMIERHSLTHSSDEYDSLYTLTKHSDERQQEERPFSVPRLLLSPSLILRRLFSGDADNLGIECLSELDPPFDSASVHLQESNTHDVDDDGCDEGEDTFP
jgi:hypothetical protein